MRNFTASQVKILYKQAWRAAFAHVPMPRLKINIGDSGKYAACGEYDPNDNSIRIWLGEHETLDEIFDTVVHELCHAEQEKRLQPLLHGPRFSRRIRVQKRRIQR
jgi:hypothetical protein